MNFYDSDESRKESRPTWKHLAPGPSSTLPIASKVNVPHAIYLDCCHNADPAAVKAARRMPYGFSRRFNFLAGVDRERESSARWGSAQA
jgi:hypothetical protein